MQDNKSSDKTWEKYWQSPEHQPKVVHKELLENIIKYLVNVNNKTILEVGGGMGGDSLELARHGAKVTIVDFSKKALEFIKNEGKKENITITVINADAQNLPFQNETFDCIFHQGLLEHFLDPQRLLEEQFRVLKRGGILVVDVPQRYTTYTIKKHLLMKKGKWFAGWEKEFSIDELENLLKKYGFKIIKSYGWGYYGKLYKIRNLRFGKLYEKLWEKIENSRLKLYLSWCIGVISQKPI